MARILIADDSSFMRLMLKEILTRMGHSVTGEAADGREVIAQVSAQSPDIVTMDLTMPNMDGLEAIRWLRETHPDCRIIVCSAQGKDDVVKECLSWGALDFITKPFQADQVARAITRALS